MWRALLQHYFVHGCFLKKEAAVITDATILAEHKIPGVIVHGRYGATKTLQI